MNIWLYKYEAIKMWTYTNMRVYKYDATEIWGHKNMRLYKYEDKQPWGSTHMRLCKYETIQLLCFPCTQHTSWHGKWCLTWLTDILNWSAEWCQRLWISTSCNLHQHLSADVNIILINRDCQECSLLVFLYLFFPQILSGKGAVPCNTFSLCGATAPIITLTLTT